ncbi:hypothetical protein CONPUDRAFT_138810 [Coniophora puteana RWD-64-598 SS2]|uniref:C2H2-type domain-containing protein n=1 Tax=Coniophora puteana (strain RWD-64-598) TaxID=741705 RepID=A0A5M3MHZ2_CONPW|nr:uncharacterized protein CONPUDRAFT_138810 [Coniophora puteana RWD-64-598 SS2]EIW78626.1 hypothetical protein CONPUDRAFT_138810 [Coniophora puteana RWD-64-598 SS2]
MEENRYTPSTPDSEDDLQHPLGSSPYPSVVMGNDPFPSPPILYSGNTPQNIVGSGQQPPYRYIHSQSPQQHSEWRPYGMGEHQHGQAPPLRQQSDLGYPESSQRTTFGVAHQQPSAVPPAYQAYGGVSSPVNHLVLHQGHRSNAHTTPFSGASQSSIAMPDPTLPPAGPFDPVPIAHPHMQQAYAQTPNQALQPSMALEPSYYSRGQHPHAHSQAAPGEESRTPSHLDLPSPHSSFPRMNMYPPHQIYPEGQGYQPQQQQQQQQQQRHQPSIRSYDPVYSSMEQTPLPLPGSPESMARSSPEHMYSYWPNSPASEPAWSGSMDDDESPSFERGDTPLSDTGRFGEYGYRYHDDEFDEDTVTPTSPELESVSAAEARTSEFRLPSINELNLEDEGSGKGKEKAPTKEAQPKKPRRKSKYHDCPVCGKAFPRPSGLATHMNSHTGSRRQFHLFLWPDKHSPDILWSSSRLLAFQCKVPGCDKRFAVRSNAKRHLRTHGLSPDFDSGPREPRFVVGFEDPVVSHDVQPPERNPAKFKWIEEKQEGSGFPDFGRAPTRRPWAPLSSVPGPSRLPDRGNTAGRPPQQQRQYPPLTDQNTQSQTRGGTGQRAVYPVPGIGSGSSRQTGRSDADEKEEVQQEGGDDSRHNVGGRRNMGYHF